MVSGFWERQNAIAAAELPSTQKLILYVINNHQGDSEAAWPSKARLRQATGLGDTAIKKAVRELTAAGILTVKVGGGRKANRYGITGKILGGLEATGLIPQGHEATICTVTTRPAPPSPDGPVTPKNKHKTPKRDGLNLSGKKTPAAAWNDVCSAISLLDPLYQSDKLREILTDAERQAARVAGGLPKIAGRDRYTATKIRTAFLNAYQC